MRADAPLVLEAHGLTKRFPGVVANEDVSLELRAGEVLALLGENGAGKSTLVKMLFGLYRPDEGEIRVKGEVVHLRSPGDAIALGVGMVHQHFQLVPPMTVAENVVLGAEPTRRRRLDIAGAEAKVRELSDRYHLYVPADAIVEDLPVGTQQRVEIVKALYRGAEILILDEPTAVLTPQETDELLGVMRELAARGTAIVFITHKLREVLAVADRITVLRGGKVMGTTRPADTDEAGLAQMMVGRSVVLRVEKTPATPGAEVLRLDGLEVADDRGGLTVRGVDLVVRAGEIVGIAGVQGNGQRELVEAVCGMRPIAGGNVHVAGHEVRGANPLQVHEMGVSHIPEDRDKHGVIGSWSIAENLVLNRFFKEPFAHHGIRDGDEVAKEADRLLKRFDVRAPSIYTTADSLSGGNKQKVIVARELAHDTALVVAAQPTRGVDVGSIEFIHNQLVRERDDGAAVLLVSAELDEVLGLADRVAVMFEGRVAADLPIEAATRERVGLLMAGASDAEVAATIR